MGGGASREPGQKTRQRPSSLSSHVQRVIASKFGVADKNGMKRTLNKIKRKKKMFWLAP